MPSFLNIQEITIDTGESLLQKNQIKITNTSNQFVNNLKLNIDTKDFPLIEQTIIRERGTLHCDKSLCILELGNLAPDETALFEYKYEPIDKKHVLSLLSHIHISYTPDNMDECITENPTIEDSIQKPIDK